MCYSGAPQYKLGVVKHLNIMQQYSYMQKSFFKQVLTSVFACSEPTNGAEVVAEILEHIGQEKGPKPHGMGPHAAIALQRSLTKSGSIRLKDSLMLAHMMDQEASKQEVSWCTSCLVVQQCSLQGTVKVYASHCSRCFTSRIDDSDAQCVPHQRYRCVVDGVYC